MEKIEELLKSEGLQHLAQKIFQLLDLKSLQRCRRVCKTWQRFIDQNIHWESKFVEEMDKQSKEAALIFYVIHSYD